MTVALLLNKILNPSVTIPLFIILPLIMNPIMLYLILNNWFFIKKYRANQVVAIIAGTGIPVLSVLYYISWINYYLERPFLFFAGLIEISAYIAVSGIISFVILLLSFFGKNWLMRRKHFFHDNYGPYLIYTQDPTSSIKICGHLATRERQAFKRNQNLMKFTLVKSIKKGLTNKNHNIDEDFRKLNQSYSISLDRRGLWRVNLKNLESNTRYYYSITQNWDKKNQQNNSDNQEYWFDTAPKIDELKNHDIEFLHVSDLHASGRNIKWITDFVKNRFETIPFIISSGDCVSDGRNMTHWRTFFNQLRPIAPHYPVIHSTGNHDAFLSKMSIRWRYILPFEFPEPDNGLYHYFCYKEACFIFLDNYNSGKGEPILLDEQIKWLNQTLENLPESIKYKFIIMHEGFYATCTRGFIPKFENQIIPIIKKYKINSVLCGHNHYFELFSRKDLNNPSETCFIIAGGAGGRTERAMFRKINNPPYLWEGPIHESSKQFFSKGDINSPLRNDDYVKKYQKYGFSKHHVMYVKISGNQINYEVIGKDGKTIYNYSQPI